MKGSNWEEEGDRWCVLGVYIELESDSLDVEC